MANPAPGFNKHPDYEVNIQPLDAELTVRANGQLVATSKRAVEVIETKHRPVFYIPFEDIDPACVKATDTDTFCPFKGHASYWSIVAGDTNIDDAIWAYLSPYDECESIRGYASFYTNKVDLYLDGQPENKDGPGWVD